jgi:hypothetical protein
MYVLLSNYGIKPWEINGGYIYQEDLKALQTFAHYESERVKKELARQSSGNNSSQWKRVG